MSNTDSNTESNIKNNTDRFTGRTAAYDLYRQRYPEHEITTLLEQWCGLQADWLIADIGAGTGMLSELFLNYGNRVLAIEPNAEMRTACTLLAAKWPSLKVIDSTAETTGLPDHSVDIVAAGRAFHWFDTQPALTEFRRILKPNGWLVLASLGRAKGQTPQSLAFEQLLTTHGTDITYVRASYRVHENLDGIFTTDAHQIQIAGEQKLDWPSFRGQTMSLSMTPPPDASTFPAFERALRTYFDTFATNGVITTATTCWLNAGRI
jgi:ubiquinone/menaquinone biosynthesis C-methylase UbiE